jgi:hypothetical protein
MSRVYGSQRFEAAEIRYRSIEENGGTVYVRIPIWRAPNTGHKMANTACSVHPIPGKAPGPRWWDCRPWGRRARFTASFRGLKLVPSNKVALSRPTHQPSSPSPGRSAGVLTRREPRQNTPGQAASRWAAVK